MCQQSRLTRPMHVCILFALLSLLFSLPVPPPPLLPTFPSLSPMQSDCTVSICNGKTSQSESSELTHSEMIPWIFLVWCVIKTSVQLSLSICSITFIVNSGFFDPFGYDASVWSREVMYSLFLVQAIFETVDLLFETWMTLKPQKTIVRNIRLDSIFHHFITAVYYLYVYIAGSSLTTEFLGLPVAALSCQVIGILYTLNYLRYRFRLLGLCLLCVQLLYRWPLAVVSCLRAVQYFWECPWIHLFMCGALLMLDLHCTKWAFNLHNRLLKQHPIKEKMKLHQGKSAFKYKKLMF